MKVTMIAAALTAVFILPAAPVLAAGVLYDCSLEAKRARGRISHKMAFAFEDTGDVKVVDGVLLHYVGNPVPARVRKTGDVARLDWNISGAVDDAGQFIPTFAYTAKLNLKKLKLSVSAKSARFPQRVKAAGTCIKRNSTRGFPRG